MNKWAYALIVCVLLSLPPLGCGRITLEAKLEVQPSPTPTIEPTPALEWKKFSARGVEISLPESFEGGDTAEMLDMIVQRLEAMGSDSEATAQTIRNNPSAFVIFAFDSKVGKSGALTVLEIMTEKLLSSLTLETYLDAVTKQLPSRIQVRDRQTVALGTYQAGRIELDFSGTGNTAKELIYVIKDGATFWTVVFVTGEKDWDQRLPMFEASIRTFTITGTP